MEFEVRPVRTPHGPRRLVREREAYFQLVATGMSSRQASMAVGVNPTTGKRWRLGVGRSGRPRSSVPVPRVSVLPGSSARYLDEEERIYIADRLRDRASLRAIASELGRSPSTISREIRRNRHPTNGQYRPFAANARAEARMRRPKVHKIAANPQLREYIQTRLNLRWSPEQNAAKLRERFPGRPHLNVVHETIYQALYAPGDRVLSRELTRSLRTGRRMRRHHRYFYRRQPRFSAPMLTVHERPSEATHRAAPGHWEGDLIVGTDQRSAIATLVERASRYTILVHLPDGKGSASVRDALIAAVEPLPPKLRRSLTWDQGAAMSRHHEFTAATGIPVYFCDPGSPWQRGSNENTNGLLRQYFPKGTRLAGHTREDLALVADQLNSRPRKISGWRTPSERLAQLLTLER